MSNDETPKVPSIILRDEASHPSILSERSSLVALAVLVRIVPFGYPAAVLLAWVVVPPYFAWVNWLVSLFIMFVGFAVTKRLRHFVSAWRGRLMPSREESDSLESRFERACRMVAKAGFGQAADDARALFRLGIGFGAEQRVFLNVLDEGLQLHLGFLLRLAIALGIPSTAKKRRPFHFKDIRIGEGPGYSGIKIGDNILVGEDEEFEGIRIGNLEIGQYKKGAEAKSFSKAATSTGASSHEVPRLPEALSKFQEAAAHATAELAHLRRECEQLVLTSAHGNYAQEAEKLRARLETEKRVAEELAHLDKHSGK